MCTVFIEARVEQTVPRFTQALIDFLFKMADYLQFRLFVTNIFLFSLLLIQKGLCQIPESVIVLQDMTGVCKNIWDPEIKILQDRDVYQVISQTYEQQFYYPDRNCVVSITGKIGWQWSIRITKFDIAGAIGEDGQPTKCKDFLKLYDSERADEAKLLKGINYKTGMCGTLSESQIGNLLFTTCANKLTIQFKTSISSAFSRGFAMELTQYPWRNPTGGPDCDPDMNGIAAGVWRDGTFNEFQNSWNEQPVIPGYVPQGATQTDYDKEANGINCYECNNCPVTPFDPEKDGTAKDYGCYACSKEWDEEYQMARRLCYSRVDFLNLILSIQGIDDEYAGCQRTPDQFGRQINRCFCYDNLCNKGDTTKYSLTAMFIPLAVLVFLKYFS